MEFVFLVQSQLTEQDLEKIISLKKIHWNYSTEEHKNWINNNIKKDDIHVLMLENEVLVGYMNLIQTEVFLNNEIQHFLGIGNVCSLEKGLGYGRELLIGVQNYLFENNYKGILFCKDKLVGFYTKFGWTLIDGSKIISKNYKNVNVMFYNVDTNINRVEYDGRNF